MALGLVGKTLPAVPDRSKTSSFTSNSSSTDKCAICFDEVDLAAVHPCKCNVMYCTRCWDRALAQSLHFAHQARCPTCRCAVHVDFDADKGHLVFSITHDDDPEPDPEELADRLSHQTRSTQIRILQEYGESEDSGRLKSLAETPTEWLQARSISDLKDCVSFIESDIEYDYASKNLDKAGLIQYATDALASRFAKNALVSRFATLSKVAPKCVCGSCLQRAPDGTSIMCDMCDRPGKRTWTCANGTHTILHPFGYDLCDSCFVRHVTEGLLTSNSDSQAKKSSPSKPLLTTNALLDHCEEDIAYMRNFALPHEDLQGGHSLHLSDSESDSSGDHIDGHRCPPITQTSWTSETGNV